MGYFFLDIETFVSENDKISGLNPYRPDSKVLSIAFNYYDGFHLQLKDIIKPTVWKEWEEGEKGILEKFWNFIKLKIEKDTNLKFLGFNILKFDIPYLFGRMVTMNIASSDEIFDVLYRKAHWIDLMQISMVINSSRYHEFLNPSQKTINKLLGIQVKKGTGKDVTKFYNKKDYDKIMEYINEEFSFEELYIKLRKIVYSKKGEYPTLHDQIGNTEN